MEEKIDRELLKKYVKKHNIKDLSGANDFLKDIMKDVFEIVFENEMQSHLGYEKNDTKNKNTDNSRNGYSSKTVKSSVGEMNIDIPRDRKAEFDPIFIKKHQKDISSIEDKIISMYAGGMSVRDIENFFLEVYNYKIGKDTISNITDRVIENLKEWQNRKLEPIYSIVYMDALFLNIRDNGQIQKKAAYAVMGIKMSGHRDILGLWICENESSKYWLNILNELKNRGVNNVLIFSIDGLTGLGSAIETVPASINWTLIKHVHLSSFFVNKAIKFISSFTGRVIFAIILHPMIIIVLLNFHKTGQNIITQMAMKRIS